MPQSPDPPIVAVVGATAAGQDRALPRPRRAARRRDRQHRRDAGLPRHGRRHRQAARGRAPRHPAPPARPARRHRAARRSRSSRAGPAPSIAELRGRGAHAGAGRRLGALHPRRPRPVRVPRHRRGGTPRARGGAGRARGRRRSTAGSPRCDPDAAAADPPRQRPPDRPRPRGRRRSPAGRYSATLPEHRVRRPAHASRSASTSTGRPSTRGSSSASTRCSTPASSTRCAACSTHGLADGRTARPGDRLPRGGGVPRTARLTQEEARERPPPRPGASRGARTVVPQGPAHRLGPLGRPGEGRAGDGGRTRARLTARQLGAGRPLLAVTVRLGS